MFILSSSMKLRLLTMKYKSRKYNYGECEICDAKMVAKRVKQDFWIGGKLVVIDNVPAGVCRQWAIWFATPAWCCSALRAAARAPSSTSSPCA
jgi:YgiT-type zinc finger domain-containing protein